MTVVQPSSTLGDSHPVPATFPHLLQYRFELWLSLIDAACYAALHAETAGLGSISCSEDARLLDDETRIALIGCASRLVADYGLGCSVSEGVNTITIVISRAAAERAADTFETQAL